MIKGSVVRSQAVNEQNILQNSSVHEPWDKDVFSHKPDHIEAAHYMHVWQIRPTYSITAKIYACT